MGKKKVEDEIKTIIILTFVFTKKYLNLLYDLVGEQVRGTGRFTDTLDLGRMRWE